MPLKDKAARRRKDKEYREKNAEKLRQYKHEWYQNNREHVDAKTREYCSKNRDSRHRAVLKHRLKKRGLTLADHETAMRKQGGVCAICKRPPKEKRLAIDHCHATGLFRGLLCDSCNTSIGHMGDDPDRLIAAATYLYDSAAHALKKLIG